MNKVYARNNQRNGEIELLRFVFAGFVVLYHMQLGSLPVAGGYLGVEFFFILSGFFMTQQLDAAGGSRLAKEPVEDTVHAAQRYLLHRFDSVFIYYLLSGIIGYCLMCYGGGIHFLERLYWIPSDLFLWQNYGFAVTSPIGTAWYLSAAFFSMWVLYPVIRRHYTVFTGYIAPVLALVLYGIVMRSNGGFDAANELMLGFISSGFLRGIAGMAAGAFCYEFSRHIHKKSIGIDIIQILSWIMVCLYMLRWREQYGGAGDIGAVALMVIGIATAMCATDTLRNLFQHKICIMMGKVSLLLFMNHYYWIHQLPRVIHERWGLEMAERRIHILSFVMMAISCVAVYYAEKGIRRCLPRKR